MAANKSDHDLDVQLHMMSNVLIPDEDQIVIVVSETQFEAPRRGLTVNVVAGAQQTYSEIGGASRSLAVIQVWGGSRLVSFCLRSLILTIMQIARR